MRTDAIYGAPPKVLGQFDFDTSEMMFWLYCPVKLPGHYLSTYPDSLKKFAVLTTEVRRDFIDTYGLQRWSDSYVYLSAKTMFVSPGNPGNRLGWHSDGFLTDDVNYIWADKNPTLFFLSPTGLQFTADHDIALQEMATACCKCFPAIDEEVVTYPEKTLLRLDQTVLHAVNPDVQAGVRTFLKVSISDRPYVLKGNSINHELPDHPRPTEDRQVARNCPRGIAA